MELSKSLTFSAGPKGCHPKDHCFRKGFVIFCNQQMYGSVMFYCGLDFRGLYE